VAAGRLDVPDGEDPARHGSSILATAWQARRSV
jgi:hypothetical protein